MKSLPYFGLAVLMTLATSVTTANAQSLPVRGFGQGTYLPNPDGSGGTYSGSGLSTVLGVSPFGGAVQIIGVDPNNPNLLYWQNVDQGTADEQFHVNRTWFGQLRARISGQVELIPLDEAGTEFTAIWSGRFEFAGGTGLFRSARGYADMTAVNLPFRLTDTEWKFLWTWRGRMALR